MIELEKLTKRFVNTVAVDNISFTVEDNEILGLLGPNGAGKTTTMRILACFMPATSGTARVEGFDVFTQSLEVRKRIGYMPESVPLYPELRVEEYLHFRAKLKGLDRSERKKRVAEVIDDCWLTGVRRKLAGHLSKGYRQRVGLAETLINNPKVLILDEPTIGLDPSQIRQTRKLIKRLGEEHTVLLSTHILPEVEMTCDRVIIINEGRIAAMDTLDGLVADARKNVQIRLVVKGPAGQIKAALESIGGVRKVTCQEGTDSHTFRVQAPADESVREAMFRAVTDNGWTLLELTPRAETLEDRFVEIIMREKEVHA
jgi:ABC-2 type transport system ATP-binding protein